MLFRSEDLEPLEDFIQGLVDDFDNITTSDLQGIVDARCMQTHEDENEILDEIYKRVSELNECLINEVNNNLVKTEDEDNFEDLELNTDEPEDLELNTDESDEPEGLEMKPRDLDIEDVEGEVGVAEDNITTKINDANQEVNTELENNDYTKIGRASCRERV